MAERAAHLLDHVLPDVGVRQWVLTLPFRLRYRLAWDRGLCRAVAGIFARAVLRALQHRAAWKGVTGGRSGAVMVRPVVPVDAASGAEASDQQRSREHQPDVDLPGGHRRRVARRMAKSIKRVA